MLRSLPLCLLLSLRSHRHEHEEALLSLALLSARWRQAPTVA